MYQTTSSTSTVNKNTGTVCTKAGPYKSSRNAQVTISMLVGQVFPADTDGASTTWKQTVETQTASYVTTM